ncbi:MULTISPECIES: hypothetical protein [unclassified Streptomyces]|uniref:hypothetical protein n=1 Tax=unclassified Streptomyces TaxID=2593676 RepID=UPI003826CFD8
MFQDTPIFQRLVSERGDIPTQVRGEAERIRRDLAAIIPAPASAPAPSAVGARPAQQFLALRTPAE